MMNWRFRVPLLLKPLAWLVKAAIRKVIAFRLRYLPLSLGQAEQWANVLRRWPAVFTDQFAPKRRTSVPPGVLMDVGIVDAIERRLLTVGIWEPAVGAILRTYLRPRCTYFDVGANIGYFAMMASKLVGNHGTVVCFEPSIRAVEILSHNIQLNNCQNVVLFSNGLGDHPSIQTLYLARGDNIGATTTRKAHGSIGTERIAILRLDDLVDGLGLVPDLVKVDIEGGEIAALRGMERALTTHSPPVVCELNEVHLNESGASQREAIGFMECLGYDAYLLEFEKRLSGRRIDPSSDELPGYMDVLFCKHAPPFEQCS